MLLKVRKIWVSEVLATYCRIHITFEINPETQYHDGLIKIIFKRFLSTVDVLSHHDSDLYQYSLY